MLTASMLSDPAVLAQRRLCARRTWRGLCPAPSRSLCSWAPDSQAECTGEKWEWCWYHFPRGFNLLFASINVTSAKLHIVTAAVLVGYWRYFAWKPAIRDPPHSHWCSSLGSHMPHSHAVMSPELLHFVFDIQPLRR